MSLLAVAFLALTSADGGPSTLETQLASENPASLAKALREQGDANRGALIFYQSSLGCAKCHVAEGDAKPLGPELASLGKAITDAYLIESILAPSKTIQKGFETVTIARTNGKTETGLLVSESPDLVVLRDPSGDGKPVSIPKPEIEQRVNGDLSLMPAGLVNQLAGRQQFLDLLRYLREVADGGPERARQLRPSPAQINPPLPEYERDLDHAGLIADLGPESFRRGEAIYQRVCANCHGTKTQPGSLPNSLRFASGVFKNGSDPYRIYQTLTQGYGQMMPQSWMVPSQKYDVIHYLREAYLKPDNPSQFVRVDRDYLARLPKGSSKGPSPSTIEVWSAMDYGPSLTATYEVGDNGSNFAYKGVAIRLDAGRGGVSRGHHWAVYEHDTMRLAASWTGDGFIDWNGINFNGRHGIHPRTAGLVKLANPTGPGWANPADESFQDPRPLGRDGRAYGPLPRSWAHYQGQYRHGDRVILSYTVGETPVLEMPGLENSSTSPVLSRTIRLGSRPKDLVLQVARKPGVNGSILRLDSPEVVVFPGHLEQSKAGGSILAGLTPTIPGSEWLTTSQGDLRLKIPAGPTSIQFTMTLANLTVGTNAKALASSIEVKTLPDLSSLTRGGPARWPEVLQTPTIIGASNGPFAVDTFATPDSNPWLCQMRLTGLDFFPDGRGAAVCTWDGDVWRVDGFDQAEKGLSWRRIASGLFQPLGLKILDGKILIGCRDQIAILRDLNGDGETDFYENFNSDHQVTDHFHEFAMDLQADLVGNLYYAKGARHGLKAVVPHHGTLLKVSADGSKTDILATGFRAPNGVCLNDDGTFFLTDQEGFWTPKNRINWVKPGGFYGNMWGFTDVTDSSDSAMEPPVCWITNNIDRSPAEVLRVEGKGWGPLEGSLLNLSYGEGKIFVVPHESIDGRMQGGVSPLPLPAFPTGVMRGRFHPRDGQLYALGMFAWAGNRTQPGGFYRVRFTGKPVHLPIELNAKSRGMTITFSGPLDRKVASDPSRYSVKTWSLKRTESYGSKHINELPMRVLAATPTVDGRGVFLELESFQPSQCMEIRYSLKGEGGEPVEGQLDNSVYRTKD